MCTKFTQIAAPLGLFVIVFTAMSCSKPQAQPVPPTPVPPSILSAPELANADPAISAYGSIYREALTFLAERGPMRIALNWNPQAPGPFQRRDDFEAFSVEKDVILFSKCTKSAVSSRSPLVDGSFAISIRETGVLFADRSVHATTRIAPMDPLGTNEQGGMIGMDVQLHLLAVHAAAYCLNLLNGSDAVELDGAATQRLFDEIYNTHQLAGAQRVPATARSALKAEVDFELRQTVRWLAYGQPIMELTLERIQEDRLNYHRSRFAWDDERRVLIPKPSLRELLPHLQRAISPIPLAGDAWEYTGRSQDIFYHFPLSELLSGARFGDQCLLKDDAGNVKLGIGISGPQSAAVSGPFGTLDVIDGIVVSNSFYEPDDPMHLSIGFLGGDWAVNYNLGGQTGVEFCNMLKEQSIQFLHALRTQDAETN